MNKSAYTMKIEEAGRLADHHAKPHGKFFAHVSQANEDTQMSNIFKSTDKDTNTDTNT